MAKQAKIITFANQKGGAGKSTLTALTAGWLSSDPYNKNILVIDADEQGSLFQQRELEIDHHGKDHPFPYEIVYHSITDIDKAIEENIDNYDFLFLDLPGRLYDPGNEDTKAVLNAISFCDMVLIPIKSSNYDLFASLDFLSRILKVKEELKKVKIKLKVYGLINQKDQKKEFREIHKNYEKDIPVFDTHIKSLAGLMRFGESTINLLSQSNEALAKDNFGHFIDEFNKKLKSR